MKWFTGLLLLACISAGPATQPSTESLLHAAASGPTGSRIRAIDALGKLPADADRVVPVLEDIATDPFDLSLRVHAIRSLAELNTIEPLPILHRIAETSGEPLAVRGEARKATASISRLQEDSQKEWLGDACSYAIAGGDVVHIAATDLSGFSSRHMTIEQGRSAIARSKATGIDGRPAWQNEFHVRDYVTSLPAMKMGEYGHIYNAKVWRVLGPTKMIITNFGQLDAEGSPQMAVITGFPTAGLADEAIWYGDMPPLSGKAVNAGAEVYVCGTFKIGSATLFEFIPLKAARRGVSLKDYPKVKVAKAENNF